MRDLAMRYDAMRFAPLDAIVRADGEGEEVEEDSDEMPSLDVLATLKRGMRRMHKRSQDEDDDDDDDNDESEDDDDESEDDDDESKDDDEGEEEEDEGKPISALRRGRGPKRSAVRG